jgi:hypothetical protein
MSTCCWATGAVRVPFPPAPIKAYCNREFLFVDLAKARSEAETNGIVEIAAACFKNLLLFDIDEIFQRVLVGQVRKQIPYCVR